MSVPDSKLPKSDACNTRVLLSTETRRAGRAAQRSIERHNDISDEDEVDTLSEQFDEIDDSEETRTPKSATSSRTGCVCFPHMSCNSFKVRTKFINTTINNSHTGQETQ
jgi:hypothetical protein